MQLEFSKLKPVIFGGTECEPKIDKEIKAKISLLNIKDADFEQRADELLSSCFAEEIAKDVIKNHMSLSQKFELAVYLSGGEDAVRKIRKIEDKFIDKVVEDETNN